MAPTLSGMSAIELAEVSPLINSSLPAIQLDSVTYRVYMSCLVTITMLVDEHDFTYWGRIPVSMLNALLTAVEPDAGQHETIVRTLEEQGMVEPGRIKPWQRDDGDIQFRTFLPCNPQNGEGQPLSRREIEEALDDLLNEEFAREFRSLVVHPSLPAPDPRLFNKQGHANVFMVKHENVPAAAHDAFQTLVHLQQILLECGFSGGVTPELLRLVCGNKAVGFLKVLEGTFRMDNDGSSQIYWPNLLATVNKTKGELSPPRSREELVGIMAKLPRYAELFPEEQLRPKGLPQGEVLRNNRHESVKFFTWLRVAYEMLIKAGHMGGVSRASARLLGETCNLTGRQLSDRFSKWEGRVIHSVGDFIAILPGAAVTRTQYVAKVNRGKILAILAKEERYSTKVRAYKRRLDQERAEAAEAEAEQKASEGSSNSREGLAKALAGESVPTARTKSLVGVGIFWAVLRACEMLEELEVEGGVPNVVYRQLHELIETEPDKPRDDARTWERQKVNKIVWYEGCKTYQTNTMATIDGPEGDYVKLSDQQIIDALKTWVHYADLDFSAINEAGSSKSSAPSEGQGKAKEERVLQTEKSSTRALMDALVRADAMLEKAGHTTGVEGHAMVPIGRLIDPNMDAAGVLYRYGKRGILESHSIHSRRTERKLAANVVVQGPAFEPVSDAQILEALKASDRYADLDFSVINEAGSSKSPAPSEDKPKADAPAPTPEAAKGTEMPFYRAEALTGRSVLATAVRALELLKAVGWNHGLPGSIWTQILHAVDPSTKEENQRCEFHHSAKRKGCMVNNRIPGSHEHGWKRVPGTTLVFDLAEPLSNAEILELLKACKPLKDLDFAALEAKKPAGSSKSPAPSKGEQKADAPAPTPEASAPTPALVGEDTLVALCRAALEKVLTGHDTECTAPALEQMAGELTEKSAKFIANQATEAVDAWMAERERLELETEARELEERLAEVQAQLAKLKS